MKVFVTVGTTPFDELIESIDSVANKIENCNFIYQVSEGKYSPVNGECFKFTNNVEEFYQDSDLIITHAGAGSIYNLLELKKKIIIVPNMGRVDKHQRDIASFMDANGFAKVIWDLNDVENTLMDILNFNPSPFIKDSFFKKDEIINYIKENV